MIPQFSSIHQRNASSKRNQLDKLPGQILETIAYPKLRKRTDDTNKYAGISPSLIRQFCASWSMRLIIQTRTLNI